MHLDAKLSAWFLLLSILARAFPTLLLTCLMSTELTLFSQCLPGKLHQQKRAVDVAKCLLCALTSDENKDLKLVLLGRAQLLLTPSVDNDFSGNTGHFGCPSSAASPATSISFMSHNSWESTSVFYFQHDLKLS